MNHQPYESWILKKPEMNDKEVQILKEHLLTCSQCQKLTQSWQEIENILSYAPMEQPAVGFGKRFKASLADRRERQHHAQVLRFIFISSVASLVALLILVGRLLSKNSLTEIVVSIYNFLSGIISQIGSAVQDLFNSLQGPTPILLWIIATSFLMLLSLGWGYSIWKLVIKGARS
jgi:predicted anti-sigma-YlaC factor YlaD